MPLVDVNVRIPKKESPKPRNRNPIKKTPWEKKRSEPGSHARTGQRKALTYDACCETMLGLPKNE